MEKIIQILEEIRPDIDFRKEKKLIDGGLLDSFNILQLVDALADEYDLDIKPEDLVPQNFNSAEAIYEMMQRLLNKE